MTQVDFKIAEANTGYKEFRIHNWRPQSRTKYVCMNIKAEVPDDKLEQYKSAFSCLSSLPSLKSDLTAYILTPPGAFLIIVNLIVMKGTVCFASNGLSAEEIRAVFKNFYLSERWGSWG